MIDFNTFELDRLSKLLETLQDYTDNNLRFPKAGEIVEKAYACLLYTSDAADE